MKRLAIYGLRRSGNHAVIEWILKNLSGCNERHVIKESMIFSGNSCHLNAINQYRNEALLRIDHLFATSSFKNLIISYEDRPSNSATEFSLGYTKVVIIRDIYNVIASRYKKLIDTKSQPGWQQLMKIDESIFTIWKQHAAAAKQGTTMIRFEDWIEGKEARNAISKSLGLENLDHTNTMSHHGGGSSFNPHHWTPPSGSDLNNRWRQVELPKALLERMKQEDIQVTRSQLGYHE